MSSYLSVVIAKSITQQTLNCRASTVQPGQCWSLRTERESSNPGAIFYVASNNIDVLSTGLSGVFYFTRSVDIDCEHSSRQYKLTLIVIKILSRKQSVGQISLISSHHTTRGDSVKKSEELNPSYQLSTVDFSDFSLTGQWCSK